MTAWWYGADFQELLPYLKAIPAFDKRGGKHCRLEVKAGLPWAAKVKLLSFRAPCAACGEVIAPFRARKAKSKRGVGIGGIYAAVTCDQDSKKGCSRGMASSIAYDAIEQLINGHRQEGQGGLL